MSAKVIHRTEVFGRDLRGKRKTGRIPKDPARSLPYLVAGELLAESRESLVVSKGARRGALRGEAARSRRSDLFGVRLGLDGLGDLLLVLLPASLRRGVLVLPGDASLVVALEPLVGLGVEALGDLVLAVLVVLGGHAVERRVELGAVRVDHVVGLLERQRDAATVEVDVDDADEELLADRHNLLGHLDVLV